MKIKFKNNSYIKILSTDKKPKRSKRGEEQIIRGYRAKGNFIDWSDCQLSKKEIDAVIKPFMIDYFKRYPSEFIIYCTGQKLSFWQRFLVDKIWNRNRKVKHNE